MIELTKNYAIKADRNCFTICIKGTEKGETVWNAKWYFTSLDHVFLKIISLSVAEGIKKGSWEAVSKELTKAKNMIEEKMDIILNTAKKNDIPLEGKKLAGLV